MYVYDIMFDHLNNKLLFGQPYCTILCANSMDDKVLNLISQTTTINNKKVSLLESIVYSKIQNYNSGRTCGIGSRADLYKKTRDCRMLPEVLFSFATFGETIETWSESQAELFGYDDKFSFPIMSFDVGNRYWEDITRRFLKNNCDDYVIPSAMYHDTTPNFMCYAVSLDGAYMGRSNFIDRMADRCKELYETVIEFIKRDSPLLMRDKCYIGDHLSEYSNLDSEYHRLYPVELQSSPERLTGSQFGDKYLKVILSM